MLEGGPGAGPLEGAGHQYHLQLVGEVQAAGDCPQKGLGEGLRPGLRPDQLRKHRLTPRELRCHCRMQSSRCFRPLPAPTCHNHPNPGDSAPRQAGQSQPNHQRLHRRLHPARQRRGGLGRAAGRKHHQGERLRLGPREPGAPGALGSLLPIYIENGRGAKRRIKGIKAGVGSGTRTENRLSPQGNHPGRLRPAVFQNPLVHEPVVGGNPRRHRSADDLRRSAAKRAARRAKSKALGHLQPPRAAPIGARGLAPPQGLQPRGQEPGVGDEVPPPGGHVAAHVATEYNRNTRLGRHLQSQPLSELTSLGESKSTIRRSRGNKPHLLGTVRAAGVHQGDCQRASVAGVPVGHDQLPGAHSSVSNGLHEQDAITMRTPALQALNLLKMPHPPGTGYSPQMHTEVFQLFAPSRSLTGVVHFL
mmetsp:Transcript_10789/g.25800  ORF Transcript_10789/g.25800 Transcript_10789/m.25800 type:complete len:418 (+) Transcript_10789:346-1599(+)